MRSLKSMSGTLHFIESPSSRVRTNHHNIWRKIPQLFFIFTWNWMLLTEKSNDASIIFWHKDPYWNKCCGVFFWAVFGLDFIQTHLILLFKHAMFSGFSGTRSTSRTEIPDAIFESLAHRGSRCSNSNELRWRNWDRRMWTVDLEQWMSFPMDSSMSLQVSCNSSCTSSNFSFKSHLRCTRSHCASAQKLLKIQGKWDETRWGPNQAPPWVCDEN